MSEAPYDLAMVGYGPTGMTLAVNRMIFGLTALAAPVFGAGGEIEVAMGMILPGGIATDREIARLGMGVRAAADRASRELGFDG